jgi:hypothetical protein
VREGDDEGYEGKKNNGMGCDKRLRKIGRCEMKMILVTFALRYVRLTPMNMMAK